MEYLIVKKLQSGGYWSSGNSDPLLEIVSNLLEREVKTTIWLDWLDDPSVTSNCGNIIGFAKDGENVLFYNIYDETDADFAINAIALREIVVTWLELYKQRPPFITLFMQDDKFWLCAHTDRCSIDDATPLVSG